MAEETELKPAEAKVFGLKGRFNRTKFSFWASTFLALPRMLTGAYPIGLFIFPVTFTFYILAVIKRLRDINASPWWALIAWIPILNIPLLFIPGKKGENQYGLAPKDSSIVGKIIAIIMPLALAGIFAVILAPKYQENYEHYKQRVEQQSHL